ncbi:MAG: ATP-dependent DNA ligase [Frankia sp.]
MLLADLADTSGTVAGSAARSVKIAALAECLRRAGPDDVPVAVAFLSGVLVQRQIGVGWASLRDLPAAAESPSLQVGAVNVMFERIGAEVGPGSIGRRRDLLTGLFAEATAVEQDFLRGLLAGEPRQGALEGIMVEAVARAAEAPAATVRRALMLRGDLGVVAAAALRDGAAGLARFRLEVGRALRPMLAQSAPDLDAALGRIHPAAIEWKLDGVRVQVHRSDDVRIFTRSLDDITGRLPEVVAAVLALPVRSAVFDGEVIALREDGRPRPFQVTASRVGTRGGPAAKAGAKAAVAELPLAVFFFDVLHLDGEDLLDRAGADRQAALTAVVPAALRPPRLVVGIVPTEPGSETGFPPEIGSGPEVGSGSGSEVGSESESESESEADRATAAAFLADAVGRGHEGVMVKSLTAPYEAGRRGAGWLKVKPRHTLDLVVLAAEWGHGRRRGWLSNLHLGARDPAGGFVMLGKTFKGMTDEMLAWQTERLRELADASSDDASSAYVVRVRPELVVEVAFDGLQTSTRYPGGLALRFARIIRYRPDKTAAESDTIDSVRALMLPD